MKKIKNQQGVTLIELLVYLSIMAIVLLALTSFSQNLLILRAKNQVISEVEDQGNKIVQVITRAILNSENIISPSQGISSDMLSLNTLEPLNNPTNFYLVNNILYIKEGAASQIDLTNNKINVTNLNFKNLSLADTSGSISFSFELSYNNESGRSEYSYARTFYGAATLR